MIIVTGATGQLGRAIIERLVHHVPASDVVATARDPEKAATLSALGVRVRAADFAKADGLTRAFEGATQLLVVSSNARSYGGDPLAQHRAVIDAARAAGARRILYTSHMAASSTSAFGPARDHAATEAMLAASGVAWTSLRNGFYAASGVAMVGDAFTSGTLEAPADGKVSWTAHADLAEAAARILARGTDPLRGVAFDGPTPPLVAPEALDLGDVARIGGEILGRDVARSVIQDDALRAKIAARGAPPSVADVALGFFRASRGGEFQAEDGTLERLIERPATPMRAVVAAKLAR